VTDLDTTYSALCDALRARGDVDALRAQVVLAGALAGLRYAGGAPTLRGDLGELRRVWDAFARRVSVELHAATRTAGTLTGREAAAIERRWDAHVSVTDARWDDVMRRTA